MELHLWQICRQEVGDIVDVALNIVKQLSDPLVAVGHGGLRGDLAEDIAEMRFHVLYIRNIGLAQAFIGNDSRRSSQSSQIEGLGSRMEGDAVHGILMSQGGKRYVFVARQHQIAMDFVGNDQHIVFQADFAQKQQLVSRPATAHGVMRITKNQHLGGLGLFGQLVEVDFVAFSPVDQGIVDQFPSVTADGMMERRIDRRLDNDFISRLGKGQHRHVEAADHTWSERHPFRRHIPVMAAFQPACDRLKIWLVLEVIAIDGVFGSFDDCLTDEIGRLEVHVGHPHRQHVRVAENLFSQVVFHAVSIRAIDHLVEIVFHCLRV